MGRGLSKRMRDILKLLDGEQGRSEGITTIEIHDAIYGKPPMPDPREKFRKILTEAPKDKQAEIIKLLIPLYNAGVVWQRPWRKTSRIRSIQRTMYLMRRRGLVVRAGSKYIRDGKKGVSQIRWMRPSAYLSQVEDPLGDGRRILITSRGWSRRSTRIYHAKALVGTKSANINEHLKEG